MAIPSPVDLLFPPKCPICQKLVGLGETICPDCARALPLASGARGTHKGDFFEGCYTPFFYEEPLRRSFLRYKFNGQQHYARIYGKWMADCLVAQQQTEFDLVTWVPLSRLRRWRRGYDQAELLASQVASHLSLPLICTLRKANRKPLSRLEGSRAIRSARILGAYSLAKGADVAGKRLLLVDDIVTSGATLNECARILKTAGAAEIRCVALARKRD